eukprot:5019632-Amphidinium_carterae.1
MHEAFMSHQVAFSEALRAMFERTRSCMLCPASLQSPKCTPECEKLHGTHLLTTALHLLRGNSVCAPLHGYV